MEFRISDTFTDSLGRLTAQEQKAVKTTAFDLQLDPSAPGLSFHRVDRAKDPNFWSLRANADIRIIVHKTAASILLVYVDHHDDAYKWAERRKIEQHPTTGAMQLVEVRELVQEVEIYRQPEVAHPVAAPEQPLFANLRKLELMAFGVPAEWVEDVRKATDSTLFEVLPHLPQEAQEALLKLAVGEKPEPAAPVEPTTDPFEHPDAQRRFRVMTNVDELRRALDYPWDKWAVFLHPAQEDLVARNFNGPARVSGSAGTGKTIVALHRAVHLARVNPAKHVLITTFSKPLANSLKRRLDTLTSNEPLLAHRIIAKPISSVGYDLYTEFFGQPQIAPNATVRALLAEAAKKTEGAKFSAAFLVSEWLEVVDAWQIGSWEAYLDVPRLGRKSRIGGKQREVLWTIFASVREGLTNRGMVTWSDVFGRVTDHMITYGKRPFDFAVVDEAQDLGVAEARFLSTLGASNSNGLFFAGDLGQRIFQQPYSWKSLGLDVRGRSSTLRINYRTSHQIRQQADRLLPGLVVDVDGISESRKGTVSTFDGAQPFIRVAASEDDEINEVGSWIKERLADGVRPAEVGIFVRSDAEMRRARSAAKKSGHDFVELGDKVETREGAISIGTMHLAKGLEFRSVIVMACDDEVIPLQLRIETVVDETDLKEVYDTERHLLYVACTRARDHLMVSGVGPASEFLEDMLKR